MTKQESTIDDILNYVNEKGQNYRKNTVIIESLHQQLESTTSNIVNVLRSNNKPASEAVLLSKKQAENVQRLKKETKAYLREYTDLIKINKDGETKESAQSFITEGNHIVWNVKDRYLLTEQLLETLNDDRKNT